MKLNKFAASFAALSVLGMGSAQADSFASAVLNVFNAKWISQTTGLPLVNGVTGNILPGGQNSALASATLNGSGPTPISSTPLVLTGGQIPFDKICTGPDCTGTPPNPGPPGNILPNGKTYSYSSYELLGAFVDIPAAGISAGATAHSTAQVDLSGKIANPSTGNSSSTVGTNTSFIITVAQTFVSHIEIDYAVDLLANVVSPSGLSDNAKASSSWSLIIRDVFTPSEIPLNFRPSDLNFDVAVTTGQPVLQWSKTATGFRSADFTLDAGDTYSFTVSSNVAADGARNFVPEPDSLALFGIGIAGVMVSALRRRKAA